LHHIIKLYRPLFSDLAVIIRPDDPFGLDACVRHGAVALVNPEAERGLGRSLAIGAEWLRDIDAPCTVIALGDMPWIEPETISAVAAEGLAHRCPVAPAFRGQFGFPRALPATIFPQLALLTEDRGASSLLEWETARRLDCDDPGILRDIDTPSDIRKLSPFPSPR
jgi:molybdenum cofactor cytidylyltransferase